LERIDFGRRDADELGRVTSECLASQGIDAERWREAVVGALGAVLETPLLEGSDGFSLSAVSIARKSPEMEFTFPVATGRDRRPAPLRAVALADALRASDALPRDYADRVAALRFAPLVGFLRGFIDLVFEHDGRYYVVDYKSNHLGATPDHYRREALRVPMAAHHYFLQYHLYTVAVHRFLGSRVPGYAYARHFGGVFYLFLRGMSPERGPRTGVFFDRPAESTIALLSRTLDTATARGAS